MITKIGLQEKNPKNYYYLKKKIYMDKIKIFELIRQVLTDAVPVLKGREINKDDSFRSLEVNSIERMEVIMLVLEELELDIPRVELLKANDLGELAIIIETKMN
jgi:polyketide biosynthesis acyl carrier protein